MIDGEQLLLSVCSTYYNILEENWRQTNNGFFNADSRRSEPTGR